MTEIYIITNQHKYWDKTVFFAKNCSWTAGPYLAKEMENNNFKDWERVIVASVDGEIAGFCTLTEKDEMPEQYEFTPFIGFVFVSEEHRGRRLSELMIKSAAKYAMKIGYKKLYLMSGEVGLYEKYGFEKLGVYPTIFGTVDQLFVREISIEEAEK